MINLSSPSPSSRPNRYSGGLTMLALAACGLPAQEAGSHQNIHYGAPSWPYLTDPITAQARSGGSACWLIAGLRHDGWPVSDQSWRPQVGFAPDLWQGVLSAAHRLPLA